MRFLSFTLIKIGQGQNKNKPIKKFGEYSGSGRQEKIPGEL
jgi:hypothetical protein